MWWTESWLELESDGRPLGVQLRSQPLGMLQDALGRGFLSAAETAKDWFWPNCERFSSKVAMDTTKSSMLAAVAVFELGIQYAILW